MPPINTGSFPNPAIVTCHRARENARDDSLGRLNEVALERPDRRGGPGSRARLVQDVLGVLTAHRAIAPFRRLLAQAAGSARAQTARLGHRWRWRSVPRAGPRDVHPWVEGQIHPEADDAPNTRTYAAPVPAPPNSHHDHAHAKDRNRPRVDPVLDLLADLREHRQGVPARPAMDPDRRPERIGGHPHRARLSHRQPGRPQPAPRSDRRRDIRIRARPGHLGARPPRTQPGGCR
jgi:hypothetical protein